MTDLKTYRGTFVVIMVLILSILGCNRATRLESQDTDFRFNRGKQRFQEQKYYKAIDDFNFVVLNSPGDERADDAQLFLADSHFEMKEYMVAASEYRRLVQRYPESPLVEQARYKLGLCLVNLSPHYQLQQEYTRQAINTLQGFVEDYPYSVHAEEVTQLIEELRIKLAHKIYSNAHLYFILRQYDSALIYYEQLINNYYDTPWANLARLERAKSLLKLGRPTEARTQLEDLLQREPKREIRTEAQRLLENNPPEPSAVTQAER